MSDIQTIAVYSITDIICNELTIAQALSQISQKNKAFLSGVAQVYDDVYFTFTPHSKDIESYVIIPVEKLSKDDLIADLNQRWHSGFRFISMIKLEEHNYYAIYAKEE